MAYALTHCSLDSRQRKKLHTERLEDEKKHFTTLISDMEEDMERLKIEKQNYADYISKLELDRDEMIRAHTLETGDLRKKIDVLTHHVQSLEGDMPRVPNHGGFPGTFNEMDSLAMDTNWENMGFVNDHITMDQAEVKQEMQMVPVKKAEVPLPAEVEKPSQGGLLFMLFLVGAFVISRRQTPNLLRRVPEDMRAASATLLDNVLKDAGISQSAPGLQVMAPQPSGAAWAQGPSAMTGLSGLAPSMLGDLSDSLTQPTQEQTNEQLFSLTAAQYNGVSSQDFLQNAPPERTTCQGRRNLAEALATMRSNSKAEVYTRSLLWDQIPGDVVRTFAKMVADSTQNAPADGSNADGL